MKRRCESRDSRVDIGIVKTFETETHKLIQAVALKQIYKK